MNLRQIVLRSLASPDRAWIVLVVGVIMIYRELMAPGRVLPGVFGAVAVCVATYSLWQHPWHASGAAMIGLGVLLLILQGFQKLFWAPTAMAAILIAAGAHSLTEPPIHVMPALAGIPLAAVTGYLFHTAIAARRRKHTI